MKDERRKITVDIDFYRKLRLVAKKENRTLAKQLYLILEVYLKVVPRQKEIEKRVSRLEKVHLK